MVAETRNRSRRIFDLIVPQPLSSTARRAIESIFKEEEDFGYIYSGNSSFSTYPSSDSIDWKCVIERPVKFSFLSFFLPSFPSFLLAGYYSIRVANSSNFA